MKTKVFKNPLKSRKTTRIVICREITRILPDIITRVTKNCRTCLQMCVLYEGHHFDRSYIFLNPLKIKLNM